MSRKAGAILSYVVMFIEVLSTLLFTPFMIRTLGQAEFGVYKLTNSITAYLLLLDLGIGNAIVRYIAKYRATNDEENSRKFMGVATIFYTAMGGIALVGGSAMATVFPQMFATGLTLDEIALGEKLLLITMINASISIGTTVYSSVILAYERFVVSKTISIIEILLRVGLMLIALYSGMGSVGIVSANLIVTVLGRGFSLWYVFCKIGLKPKFKGIKFGFLKDILIYSTFVFLQMIATQLNQSIDQILIGSLVQSSTVLLAVYGVGAQVTHYFQSIGFAFTGMLMPGVTKMVEKGATSKMLVKEMVRVGRIILIILAMIWGGFLVCGQKFIVLWSGAENAEAYIVALMLMFAYLVILPQSEGSQILWAMNEHKEQSVMKIAVVFLNTVLTAFLIQWKPLIGATIGTLISLLLGDVVVMNVIFVKKLNMNLVLFYRDMLKGILPATLLTIAIGYVCGIFMSEGWLGLILQIGVMCVAYAVTMLMFGFNKCEKQLICSILNKLKRS